ncbi:hypothetical protein PTKIN_Ptkin06aG0076100 [Pterospermum kingtungense]
MKLGYWSWVFNNVKTHFGFDSKHVLDVSSYSTLSTRRTGWGKTAMMEGSDSMKELFRRISPLGNQTIVPVLDQWVEEGNPVKKNILRSYIKQLRSYKRYAQALEISVWMSDKRYFPLTSSDVAIRLDLIAKLRGIEHAENYFNSLSKQVKGLEVYSSLLNCYTRIRSVEKAEAILQRMRNLGFDRSTLIFNNLLRLYYKIGNYMKMDSLMYEMKEKGIACNTTTYCTFLSAYGAQCNVDGIDKVLQMAESDSNLDLQCSLYTIAADAYIKAGHFEKASLMLKKSEELLGGRGIAYDHLLTHYTSLGKKEEVLRIWELYKKRMKVHNKGYTAMITSLLKFDDIETAEKIFDEWESQTPQTLSYDIRIPNFMLGVYSRKGLLEKFETLVNRIILKGKKPNFMSWYYFAMALLRENRMEEAVEAMTEAILKLNSGSWWKPCEESLAACLKCLKGEGDTDKGEKFIKLLGDRDIISSDVQVKLLSYVKDEEESKLDGLIILAGGASDGSGETDQFSELEEDNIDDKPTGGSMSQVKLGRF